MRKLTVRAKSLGALGGALVMVAIATAAVAGIERGGDDAADPIRLISVDAPTLAEGGITLLPTMGSSLISAEAATKAAEERFRGRKANEAKFVHCVTTNQDNPLNQDCWIVSLQPDGIFASSPAPPSDAPVPGGASKLKEATYMVVLIDPATSEVLLAQAGAPGQP